MWAEAEVREVSSQGALAESAKSVDESSVVASRWLQLMSFYWDGCGLQDLWYSRVCVCDAWVV